MPDGMGMVRRARQMRGYYEWRAYRAYNPRARMQFARFNAVQYGVTGSVQLATSDFLDDLDNDFQRRWSGYWFNLRREFELAQPSSRMDFVRAREYDRYVRDHAGYVLGQWADELNDLVQQHPSQSSLDGNYGIAHSRQTTARKFFEVGGAVRGSERDPNGPKCFGIELEFEMGRGDADEFIEILREKWSPDFCDVKQDGSLSHGLELATQPMTLDYFRNVCDLSVLDDLRANGARAWDTSTCGIHIHLERGTFSSKAHVWRFAKFIFGNRYQLRSLVGRDSSSYVMWGSGQFSEVSKVLKGARGACTGHYSAVNLDNNATIEVRVFKSTLRPATLTRYVEFLSALVEYTRDLSIEQITLGALDINAFSAWVAMRSNDYPTLADSLQVSTVERQVA